jgi:polysaccharide deacetylase 2 family uncharacterized protein YibQ
LLGLWCCGAQAEIPVAAKPRLVIIIDDIGHRRDTGLRAVALPGKLTLAILPHTPNGRELAERGAASGKEIMLHAPMSNLHRRPLGPGGLTADMEQAEFRKSLALAISSTPHIRGINNHMGSQLTLMREPMEWVMQEVARHRLYFVDSRTIANSLAGSVAREYGIPTLSRHVFLDHELDRATIAAKFDLLLMQARRRGVAVAIGHPHHETIDHLARELPTIQQRGFELALVSEALAPRSAVLEPDLDAVAGHVGLRLGHGVLTEMEDAGGKHRVSAPLDHTVHQVVQVADAAGGDHGD